ncbi:hypothetical protein KC131_24790 [Pseudomonas sp. JQ170]|uniref:hypothetical protein n=1 Tax=unclassified Pseudomonas TaxID=196821 RepID=UPI0026522275|nr:MULTISPECIES: hypothetical protein [unclassified Pseudomonas]MDN7143866.1 hypothetical protein [Pseudomonas sp. JQ170]WRO74220.1 hypothetical protein U9R80_17020 [Pseudomonas sp. 170C]
MKVDLPGQFDLPIQVAHQSAPMPTGSKEELAMRIAKALVKYEARPSAAIWIEIQACASAILK